MKKETFTPNRQSENVSVYPPPYDKIHRAMIARGVHELGSYKLVGVPRPASIDLSIESRVARTMVIRLWKDSELKLIQEHEREKLGSFLRFDQMINVVGRHPGAGARMSKEVVEGYVTLVATNRPVCRQEFGVSVPPYFPLDNEFDGLIYHHAWDWATKRAELTIRPSEDSGVDGDTRHLTR